MEYGAIGLSSVRKTDPTIASLGTPASRSLFFYICCHQQLLSTSTSNVAKAPRCTRCTLVVNRHCVFSSLRWLSTEIFVPWTVHGIHITMCSIATIQANSTSLRRTELWIGQVCTRCVLVLLVILMFHSIYTDTVKYMYRKSHILL